MLVTNNYIGIIKCSYQFLNKIPENCKFYFKFFILEIVWIMALCTIQFTNTELYKNNNFL